MVLVLATVPLPPFPTAQPSAQSFLPLAKSLLSMIKAPLIARTQLALLILPILLETETYMPPAVVVLNVLVKEVRLKDSVFLTRSPQRRPWCMRSRLFPLLISRIWQHPLLLRLGRRF